MSLLEITCPLLSNSSRVSTTISRFSSSGSVIVTPFGAMITGLPATSNVTNTSVVDSPGAKVMWGGSLTATTLMVVNASLAAERNFRTDMVNLRTL